MPGGPPNTCDLTIWVLGGGSLVLCWRNDQSRRTRKDIAPANFRRLLGWGTLMGAAALCCWVGAGGLRRAMTRFDNADWAQRTGGSQTAEAVRGTPPGQRALITGRIDPQLAPIDEARGFALYLGEYLSTDDTWEWDYTMAPPFTVVSGDGRVDVVNRCHDANAGWTIAKLATTTTAANSPASPSRSTTSTATIGSGVQASRPSAGLRRKGSPRV